MVAGKPKLDREFWDEPENDLTKLFPSDPHMHMINVILGRSVVTREEKCCGSANDLLLQVDTNLEQIKQGGQLLHDGIRRICHVCGVGRYERKAFQGSPFQDKPSYNMRLWDSGAALHAATVGVEVWECDTLPPHPVFPHWFASLIRELSVAAAAPGFVMFEAWAFLLPRAQDLPRHFPLGIGVTKFIRHSQTAPANAIPAPCRIACIVIMARVTRISLPPVAPGGCHCWPLRGAGICSSRCWNRSDGGITSWWWDMSLCPNTFTC